MTLPQDDSKASARAERLAAKRETYRFAYDWPPGVATSAELPKSDDYGPLYLLESAKVYAQVALNLAAMVIEGKDEGKGIVELLEKRFASIGAKELHEHVFRSPREVAEALPPRFPKSWDEYKAFFATWDEPPVVGFYDDPQRLNLAFAWQRVAGVNPMVLARCDALPDRFRVSDERFREIMGGGDSLAKAIAEQRLYLADYAVLEGIPAGTTRDLQKYVCAPMALFAAGPDRRLRPIAIQLGQSPDAPMFGPTDGWRWRMAVQLVQVADANVHEGIFHLGRTHLVMEAVKLCMERQLDESHPLYRLLHPHLETTLAINHSAKTSLIAPDGTVDHCFAPTIEAFAGVVKKALDTHPIAKASPMQDLEARGLMNDEVLEHPYRDDAKLVWQAIDAFVGEYVRGCYPDDAAVAGDTELAAFVRELMASEGGRLVDVPSPKTRDQLQSLIATFVWIAGPGHSSVNFPQFPFMGFVSNMTGASFAPIPTPETPDEEAELTKMLPPLRIAMEGVTMVYFLSNMRPSKLGHYPPFHFRDHASRKAVHDFQKALERVEATIDERDPSRLITYPFLKPSLVLQSIAI